MMAVPDDIATGAETAADRAGEDHSSHSYGATFWIALVIGWFMIAYAVWGMYAQKADANPPGLLKWVFGLALLHDAIVAPVVTIVGLVAAWLLPERSRGPIIAALGVSVLVAVFSIPLLRTFGKRELNSSTLPLGYGRNLAIVLAAIWAVAAMAVIVRTVRARR